MTLPESTQAILLLTTHFPQSNGEVRPLTPTEWGDFAEWLYTNNRTPSDLLGSSVEKILAGWRHKRITIERIQALLERGEALGLAAEKWFRSGLWVLTRQDAEYPRELKRRLGRTAPPVLFGAGNRSILRHRALAVIGSRKAAQDDLDYTKALGERSAEYCRPIVSGGARGIDQAAMFGALENGGLSVGVLAEGLQQASSSRKFRQFIQNENLLLLSPFNPEARFNPGNAMQRNKYIYCLSHAAVVVHSGKSGGTWTGAQENLKKQWVPLWVKPSNDAEAGNAALVDLGGQWTPESFEDVQLPVLLGEVPSDTDQATETTASSEESEATAEASYSISSQTSASEQQPEGEVLADRDDREDVDVLSFSNWGQEQDHRKTATSIYALFLDQLQRACSNEEVKKDKLVQLVQESEEESKLTATQIEKWLKKAVEEGWVSRRERPVRYQWNDIDQQGLLFE